MTRKEKIEILIKGLTDIAIFCLSVLAVIIIFCSIRDIIR